MSDSVSQLPPGKLDLPDDLRDAHDRVAKLLNRLDCGDKTPLREMSLNPDPDVPTLSATLDTFVSELRTQIVECDQSIAPVRPELSAAARRRSNSHDDAVALARKVADDLNEHIAMN